MSARTAFAIIVTAAVIALILAIAYNLTTPTAHLQLPTI